MTQAVDSDCGLGWIKDRMEISDLLARYCRAIDRRDWDALLQIYHPDAAVDYGAFYIGTPSGFVETARVAFMSYERHLHSINNGSVVIAGDRAEGETYFSACAQTFDPNPTHLQFGGRYLDKFERRNDEWRILSRLVAHDWLQSSPISEETKASFATIGTRGSHDDTDPSYRVLEILPERYAATNDSKLIGQV